MLALRLSKDKYWVRGWDREGEGGEEGEEETERERMFFTDYFYGQIPAYRSASSLTSLPWLMLRITGDEKNKCSSNFYKVLNLI